MQRSGGIVEPRPPHILREEECEQTKKESRNLQPEDAANPAEGPQKTAHSPARSAGEPLRLLLYLADFCRIRHDARRGRRPPGRGVRLLRGSLRALLSDAPGHAYADSQSFAQLARIHPNLSVSAPK